MNQRAAVVPSEAVWLHSVCGVAARSAKVTHTPGEIRLRVANRRLTSWGIKFMKRFPISSGGLQSLAQPLAPARRANTVCEGGGTLGRQHHPGHPEDGDDGQFPCDAGGERIQRQDALAARGQQSVEPVINAVGAIYVIGAAQLADALSHFSHHNGRQE